MFRRAERSSALLRFIVEQTLDGQADRLKEYTLGAEALGRGESFDPRIDPVVRAEASRLRTRLEQYYETDGGSDSVLLTLPKGTYVPQFRRSRRQRGAASAPPPEPPPVFLEGPNNGSRVRAIVAMMLRLLLDRGRPHTETRTICSIRVALNPRGVGV